MTTDKNKPTPGPDGDTPSAATAPTAAGSGPEVHSFEQATADSDTGAAAGPQLAEDKPGRFAGARSMWAEARSTRGGRVATMTAFVLAAIVLVGGVGAAVAGLSHGGDRDGRGGMAGERWDADERGPAGPGGGDRRGGFGPGAGMGSGRGGEQRPANPNGQQPANPNAPAPAPSGAPSPSGTPSPSGSATGASYLVVG